MLEQRLELPAQPASARRARRFVGDFLRAQGVEDVSDVCVLLTSELVTNAVLYAQSDIEVTVRVSTEGVRVAVCDASSVPPVRRLVGTEATSGRGLGLVEALSSAWGVDTSHNGAGKEVWFRVACS
jgi:anti-sigma regulatory factor (Ser/Thr protein kinase)